MAVGGRGSALCVVADIYVENRSNKKRRTDTGETFLFLFLFFFFVWKRRTNGACNA
jgi:hypothetical protein